ncbi:MAG: SUMF1/EgtB/PvdO family nonheme iron enzyme, partial [Deltaproteobacteria bacterium]|nr:SUMF1/EgtB/PvdO family nonheme iron enzyme [Deltaproteobacteria bacterium]
FGTVYRARQLAVERDVAVKVLHADIDPSSEDGRMFVHEIRSVGRIDHANVVRIHQADITHDGRLFFAMELLDGRDLQDLGAAKPLERARVVELMRQLLAGLGAAHQAGLVHADVKPANAILVDKDDGERVVLVDFGLSRLRAPDRPTASAGGTPAYMAPEQLHEGRVDARSDLFSAALVLVYLLTGWRRPNAYAWVPPFELITDAELRAVVQKALALEPAQRFQTARDFAEALAGHAPAAAITQPTPILPFRHLAPLTELDRDRMYGRETDLAALVEHALFRRSVIYTAPSGTGKTSMLRAGLMPRLEALGIRGVYLRCRADSAAALAAAIWPGATTIVEAVTCWHEQRGGRLVLVLDQLEAALGDADFVPALLAFETWPATVDISLVLSIREDHLARLVARTQELEPGMPIVRLPPLSPAGARGAIVGPLTEARLAIEPDLLDALLADLEAAAAAIGTEMGWGGVRAIYPPHLQLACSVLYEALGPGEATLTLAHYRRLGGYDAIVGEYLDRVLDIELAGGRDVIARDLFVALVTTAHERAVRSETELVEIVGAKHGAAGVTAVLELLRSRGLLVRVRGDGDASWELVHDSLVKRVLAWVDRKDLARRRAIELVRYHLRRSRPETPSLLGRAELRELRAHAAAIAELELEWAKRGAAEAWTPKQLVARSHQVLRRRTATISLVLLAAFAVASVGMYRSHVEEERARAEARLKELDLGKVVLSIEAFAWDVAQHRAVPAPLSAIPELSWALHAPDDPDADQPGRPYEPSWLVRGTARVEGAALVEPLEVHGGRAFLVVARSGCEPSVVPLRKLPGVVDRERPATLNVRVPTCAASRADMIEIPDGEFIYGGVGEPASAAIAASDNPRITAERRVDLPAFRIDRFEVSHASYAVLTGLGMTGIAHAETPRTPHLELGREPRKPASFIDWYEARAFCRFHGKQLPTSWQWVKAMRGGLQLADGSPNPRPRRNLPWGEPQDPVPANIGTVGPGRTVDVGTSPGDVSPYGVHDLAGNVVEWTESKHLDSEMRVIRGGDWDYTTPALLVDYLAIENPRHDRWRHYNTGFRCVDSE